MRIISGERRGKKLFAPDGMAIRPTADRVKEALFDILQFDLAGCRFLDLFSGSGQIGIEALSRGAAEAVFADCSKASLALTGKNLRAAGFFDRARLVHGDFEDCLRRERGVFDAAFLDPPYSQGILERALPLTASRMKDGGVILCEHPAEEELPVQAGDFLRRKTYRYGKIALTAYRKAETP